MPGELTGRVLGLHRGWAFLWLIYVEDGFEGGRRCRCFSLPFDCVLRLL